MNRMVRKVEKNDKETRKGREEDRGLERRREVKKSAVNKEGRKEASCPPKKNVRKVRVLVKVKEPRQVTKELQVGGEGE